MSDHEEKSVNTEKPSASGDDVNTNKQRSSRPERNPELDLRTVFVKGLPWAATEEQVKALPVFSKCQSMRIVIDEETKKSKGFGYMEFLNEADAAECFGNRFDAELGERKLFLDFVGEKARFVNRRSKNFGNQRGRGGNRGNNKGYRGNRGGGYRGGNRGGQRGQRGSRGGGSNGDKGSSSNNKNDTNDQDGGEGDKK